MKSSHLVLSLLALIGAAASTALYFVIGDTKAALQQELVQAQTHSATLDGQLGEARDEGERLKKRLVALDADLGDTKSRLSAAETRTVQMSRELNQARSQLSAKEETERQLTQDVAALKRELIQSSMAIANAVSPEEVKGYRETIAQLNDKVSTLESTLLNSSAITSIASPAPNSGVSANLTMDRSRAAQIVSVGPQNAFVVLNYGSAHGATAAQELHVQRGTQSLATVHISDVRQNYSIAQVVPASLQGALQKGDAASIIN